MATEPAAILDVDGTLVDSNYQHAIAWFHAFRHYDVTVPVWRIHRSIGMGGDQLITHVAGEEVESACGEEIRRAQSSHYDSMLEQVRPFEGSRELISKLSDDGREIVLASSASEEEVQHYIALLEAEDLIAAHTTADDVEATKPNPDLVLAALEKIDADKAVMLGDSTWDVEAAGRAGIPSVAVLTGGFSESELRDAGAASVHESVTALTDIYWSTLLGS